MKTGKCVVHTEGNITTLSRMMRAATAIVMLGYPMFVETNPLGIIALLPLIAIYPMFTAVVGWDPLRFIMETSQAQGRIRQLRFVGRFVLLLVGATMLGVTLTKSGLVGLYALLALAAIVPIFIAILGEDPLEALLESSKKLRLLQAQDNSAPPGGPVDNFVMDENASPANPVSRARASHATRKAA
jgi:hypothetical protein